jgi:predicted exporter
VFPVAAATLCGFALLALGLPLTLLTPLALALSDRLGDGLAAAVALRWERACRGSA